MSSVAQALSLPSDRTTLGLVLAALLTVALGVYGFEGSAPFTVHPVFWFRLMYAWIFLWLAHTASLMNYYDPIVAYFWYFVGFTLLGTDPGIQSSIGVPMTISARTCLALALNIAGMVAGAHLIDAWRRRGAIWTPRTPPRFTVRLGHPAIMGAGLIVWGAGVCLTLFLIVAVWGFIPLLADNAENVRVEVQAGLGFIVTPATKGLHVGALVVFTAIAVARRGMRLGVLLLLVTVPLLLTFGFRSIALELLLEAYVIHAVVRRGRIRFWRSAALATVLFVILGVTGFLRSDIPVEFLTPQFALSIAVWRAGLIDVRILQQIMEHYPSHGDFLLGWTFVADFLALFPGPDSNSGLMLKKALGLEFAGAGITPSFPGEFYLNFGWPGVVLGSVGFGALLRRLAYWICDRREIDVLQLVRCTIVVFMIAGMSTGLIGAIFFVHMLPVLLLLLLTGWLAETLPLAAAAPASPG